MLKRRMAGVWDSFMGRLSEHVTVVAAGDLACLHARMIASIHVFLPMKTYIDRTGLGLGLGPCG